MPAAILMLQEARKTDEMNSLVRASDNIIHSTNSFPFSLACISVTIERCVANKDPETA